MDLKILLIDDSKKERARFAKNLQKTGHKITVLEADSAWQGLETIRASYHLDCIFLKDSLPDVDGLTMLRKLYDKKTDLAPFPIVLITDNDDETPVIKAIQNGAQDYLNRTNISPGALHLAMAKARRIFDLKQGQHKTKEILEHSQKMEAVGKLTGGIAHDFNNILTITYGNTHLLLSLLQQKEIDTERCINKALTIQQAIERGAELVKRLMIFSRQRKLEPVTTDINTLLTGLQELLKRSLGDFVQIRLELDKKLNPADIDPGQFEHAVINMGVNARDAMPDGGTLTLKTENAILKKTESAALGLKPGPYVKITIADTGTGIPADIIENIFDPFFTTKDVGKGTGLGLSMVYGFIRESGGAITVKSVKGEGTAFMLYFPQSKNGVAAQTVKKRTAKKTRGGKEIILLVEDEPEIRTLTGRILRSKGYTVLEAANSTQALNILKENSTHIDLVFTDIAMPGEMNGIQMAARAQVIRADIKLLFTTGYASGAVPDMELAEKYPLIHKPYSPDDLAARVRDVLDG